MSMVGQGCPPEAELAGALAGAATDVFQVMLDVQVLECSIEHANALPGSGVLAVLGFTGSSNGAGMVWCLPEGACRLASHMLMTEYDEPCDEVLDAVGEIANMIVGNVKSDLEAVLGPLSLSTPTVICGEDFKARKGNVNDWTTVALQWGELVFVTGISIAGAIKDDSPVIG